MLLQLESLCANNGYQSLNIASGKQFHRLSYFPHVNMREMLEDLHLPAWQYHHQSHDVSHRLYTSV